MASKSFTAGDRVAHSARVAYQHGTRSVATWRGVQALDPDSFKGTIVGPEHEGLETSWIMTVDSGADGGRCAGETRGFTADSLVKIEE